MPDPAVEGAVADRTSRKTVRVVARASFEPSRLGREALSDAYERAVPAVKRRRSEPPGQREVAGLSDGKQEAVA